MNWKPLASSNISAIAYDPEKNILSVIFHNSGMYHYKLVPEYMFDDMLKADSPGRYLAENVKPKFPVEKEKHVCPVCQIEMRIIPGRGDIWLLWDCPNCHYVEPVE